MPVTPTKDRFLSLCDAGGIPVTALEIPYARPADLYHTVPTSRSILLESGKGPEHIARYSFIAFDPYLEFKARDGVVEVRTREGTGVSMQKPLSKLRDILRAYPHRPDPLLPPFQGGAAGLLSYDFVRYIEQIPKSTEDDLGVPDAHFLIVDKVIAFDHRERRTWIVVCPGARQTRLGHNPPGTDFDRMYDEAVHELLAIRGLIQGGARDTGATESGSGPRGIEVIHEMDATRYKGIVGRVKEYIAAGDIFQANIAQRFSSDLRGVRPWDLYRRLAVINPAPFSAFADFGEYAIVSSSPERLAHFDGHVVSTRPIAGTRPRGRDLREDEKLRRELLLNEKERAEHIMLIDLERNDLGRVCDYGSVVVDELMVTEDYSHVMHIVSNVRGSAAPGRDCFDVIRAVFPGGTITGVPKVRCMEIIDELEPVRRGAYTGSLGYIGFSGRMDLNIVIRTFVCARERVYLHAGAGIVADSDPDREYEETLRKAEALFRTLDHFG